MLCNVKGYGEILNAMFRLLKNSLSTQTLITKQAF